MNISAYRGFTATAIKTRAEIPDQADMTVNGSDVIYNNITMTKIRDGIGAAILTQTDLVNHANVNIWSGFGPIRRRGIGLVLVNDVVEPYSKTSFAGYNHTAITPGWITSAPSADMWINSGGNADFIVDVYVGEVQWQNVAPSVIGITLAIYDGSTIVAWGSRNFNSASVQDDVTGLTATLIGVTIEKTYTGKVWMVDDTTDFDGSQAICRLPNTSDFSQTVKIKAATGLDVLDSGLTVESAGFNLFAGTCGFTKFSHVSNDYSNVYVTAILIDWLGAQVGSTIVMYNDAYFHGDEAFPTVNPAKPNGDPVDAYGYMFVIEFALTV